MICENQKRRKATIVKTAVVIVSVGLWSCTQQPAKQQEVIDLPQIRGKKTLVVATNYNPADYFICKGEPMGFQYEMLTELGEHLGVKIELLTGKSYMDNLRYLSQGRCDMIASSLQFRAGEFPAVDADTLYMARQVLVQRKPAVRKHLTNEEAEQYTVRNPNELNGKPVYASGWSPLTDGKDFVRDRHIRFTQLKGVDSESLIGLVAGGKLDYAVCSRSVACLVAGRYKNIDVQTDLGELPVGWSVRPESVELRREISRWMADFKKTAKYAVLYQKYHQSKIRQADAGSKYFAGRTGIISEYDELFKKYSKEIDWDWLLLASLVCQESRFKPAARSRKGAYGLMQMMPATLQHFGADTASSPEKHIAAGVAYIKHLDGMFAPTVTDDDERIKFVLASYNIGPGHIFDARRLAGKYGKNAAVWDNSVDSCLLSKADPRFYNDPEVRFGKCRGKETYSFVTKVLERYEHYKNINRIR